MSRRGDRSKEEVGKVYRKEEERKERGLSSIPNHANRISGH